MFSFFYITCKNNFEAKKISSSLIKKKLIACGNIIGNVNSLFLWNRKVNQNKEVILIGKTLKKNERKIIEIVKSIHSYSVPCIIFFKISGGNKDFLKWIKNSTI